jgi:transcriptional regulator with XRE-family HTH domain
MAIKRRRHNAMRWLRRHKGLTQKGLAARLGVTYQAVQKWENETRAIRRRWLPGMARALDMPIDELERRLEEAGLLSSQESVR